MVKSVENGFGKSMIIVGKQDGGKGTILIVAIDLV